MKFRIRVRRKEENSKVEEFTREAESADELIRRLQMEGYLVLSVQDPSVQKKSFFSFGKAKSAKIQGEAKPKSKLSEIALFESVSGAELLSFFVQLIALLRAGVPILRSLSIIEQGLKRGLLKKVILSTISKISQGYSFSSALSAYPKVFPSFWFGLIEAGEASGNLPNVLEEIKGYQEVSNRFASKLTSAMVYPAILICFCIGAIAVFMIKVIPTFEQVFKSLGSKKGLPAITQFVMNASRFLQTYYVWIGLGIGALVTIYIYLNRNRSTRRYLDQLKLQIPIVSAFLMDVAIVRFTRGLGTMVRSGIPIIKAMEISSRLVGNVIVEDKVALAKEEVKKGSSVAVSLEKHRAFPIFVTQLIAVGEESGSLDKFLDVIANFFQEKVDATISRLSVMIEPIIILIMGIVVGTLVISMFLPLIEISTGGT